MKHSRNRFAKVPVIGDLLFSMFTLPLAFGVQDVANNYPDEVYLLCLVVTLAFVCMGIACLFRAFRRRRESPILFYKYLIYSVLFVFSPLLMIPLGATVKAVMFLCTIHWYTLLINCVISCFLNHKLRNIVLKLILIFLIIGLFIGLMQDDEGTKLLIELDLTIAGMQALVSIMSAAFVRIRLDVLRNVIRGTYATEVILGLLLLIFSFSSCLVAWEPNISSFSDAVWYCFAIVTTIGFGDITAVTIKGRILSIILGLYGIVVVSLITSVIVNFYSEIKEENSKEITDGDQTDEDE